MYIYTHTHTHTHTRHISYDISSLRVNIYCYVTATMVTRTLLEYYLYMYIGRVFNIYFLVKAFPSLVLISHESSSFLVQKQYNVINFPFSPISIYADFNALHNHKRYFSCLE